LEGRKMNGMMMILTTPATFFALALFLLWLAALEPEPRFYGEGETT
jgi:hypothetical protein